MPVVEDIRVLFGAQLDAFDPTLVELHHRGFCSARGQVVSPLLVDLYLA